MDVQKRKEYRAGGYTMDIHSTEVVSWPISNEVGLLQEDVAINERIGIIA
jgi:hypothetical protein